jgi:hypothetical protein
MKLRNIGYAVVVAVAAGALVLGTAGSSEAKGKKKVAAPPPPQQTAFCFGMGTPVCAERGGKKFTYANACWAAREGAKVVSDKACPPPKAAKAKKAKKKVAKKKAMKKK